MRQTARELCRYTGGRPRVGLRGNRGDGCRGAAAWRWKLCTTRSPRGLRGPTAVSPHGLREAEAELRVERAERKDGVEELPGKWPPPRVVN
jgi:hypothetical protein